MNVRNSTGVVSLDGMCDHLDSKTTGVYLIEAHVNWATTSHVFVWDKYRNVLFVGRSEGATTDCHNFDKHETCQVVMARGGVTSIKDVRVLGISGRNFPPYIKTTAHPKKGKPLKHWY